MPKGKDAIEKENVTRVQFKQQLYICVAFYYEYFCQRGAYTYLVLCMLKH